MSGFERVLALDEAADILAAEGRPGEAVPLLREAVALARALEGDSPDVANLLLHLGAAHEALADFGAQHAAGRAALAILEPLGSLLEGGDGAVLLVSARSLTGRAAVQLGDYPEARAHLTGALAIAERTLGPLDTAWALNGLGVLCKYEGAFAEGAEHYRRALTLLDAELGAGSLESATIQHNLGGILHAEGRFAEAEPHARRAVELRTPHVADDDPELVADLAAWAGVLDGLERYAESEPLHRRLLLAWEARLGPDHHEVGACLNNLGALLTATGRAEEGVAALRRALTIKAASVGERSPDWALTALNLAASLGGEEGRALAAAALAVCEQRLPPGHPQLEAARALVAEGASPVD